MDFPHKKNGFTLIELLVVIAIIGILSSVVVVSLGNSRAKGSDVGVVANIDTVATQAGIYQDNNAGSYGAFDNGSDGAATCPLPGDTSGSSVFYDKTIENAIASALANAPGGKTFCYASPTNYAVAVSRPTAVVATKSYFWCADSTGAKCGNDGNTGDAKTPIYDGVCVACTVRN